MIKLDGMLMIGSAGANLGKTELACAILRKFGKDGDIIGVKVTTIKDTNGQCPRGGEGCGVCSSLDGVFCITEETESGSGKDTSRLLACGAGRVFWLRVLKEHLAEGAAALLDVIGPDAASVCESNSLRAVVEPGLFFMVTGRDAKTWKDSARQVQKHADRIVVSNGKGFDLDLDEIDLVGGNWRMREGCKGTGTTTQATAIILAGGRSSRMGVDKSLLPVDGQPIIERVFEQLAGRFDQILISANEPEKLAFLGLEVVPDRIPGQGPLMGIASALGASSNDLNFVVACDIPRMHIALVEKMLAEADRSEADVVVPMTGSEEYEPLFALYRKSALEAINKVLASGGRKISDIFALCRVQYIKLNDAGWLNNLNTPAEYEEFRKGRVVSFEEAFEIVMSSARRLGTERVSIIDNGALNRVLREDVASDIDIPPFDKSVMDGFACRRADLGKELTIIETVAAGSVPKRAIGRNQCAKIMTGAVVPDGADCVIMVESAERTGENRIRFTGDSTEDHIRRKGEDAKKGDVVIRAGELIRAQQIAVLASVGRVEPLVSARPRVGIIATGSEIVEPDKKPAAGQIRNSNGYQLSAQAAGAGAIARSYGIAADDEKQLEAMAKEAAAENDVVVLSGGVSAGDYDFVREVLKKNGVRLLFERVAVKPGRPMIFGVSDEVFYFGMPGNPVSSFVMFELIVRPFLFKMMGHNLKPGVCLRKLEEGITRNRTARDSWLPVVFTGSDGAAKVEYHGSAHINALCKADGLLCMPAGVAEIKAGTIVAVRQI